MRPPPSYKTTFSVLRMYVQWNPFIVKQLGPLSITSASEEKNFVLEEARISDERPL